MKYLLSVFLLLFIGCQTATKNIKPEYNPLYNPNILSQSDAQKYKLDPQFYKKTTKIQNILIASSENVSDLAHRETAYIFDKLMENTRPDIAQNIRNNEVLCILVAWNEVTSDIPQFAPRVAKLTAEEKDFYNWRYRGFLDKVDGRHVVLFAEEDVLEYPGGSSSESILVHEFGHVVHKAGFPKELDAKLEETFNKSINDRLWFDGCAAQKFRGVKSLEPVNLYEELVKNFPQINPKLIAKCLENGDILVNNKKASVDFLVTKKDEIKIVFGGEKDCYATKNRAEYFAEGYQTWYDTNRTNDHDHNHVTTREQLINYDPYLSAFCKEVLLSTDWRYISPLERVGKDHLFDFDPSKSPKIITPEHLKEAGNKYFEEYWKPYWQRLYKKYGFDENTVASK